MRVKHTTLSEPNRNYEQKLATTRTTTMTTTQPKPSAREMRLSFSLLSWTLLSLGQVVETEFQLDAAKSRSWARPSSGLNCELVEETHKKKKRSQDQIRQAPPEEADLARVPLHGTCWGALRRGPVLILKRRMVWLLHRYQVEQRFAASLARWTPREEGVSSRRIDQFQDGEDGVPPYKDATGIIRIEWTSDEMKTRVEEELGRSRDASPGRAVFREEEEGPQEEAPPSLHLREIQSAQDLADALEDAAETKTQPLSSAGWRDEDSTGRVQGSRYRAMVSSMPRSLPRWRRRRRKRRAATLRSWRTGWMQSTIPSPLTPTTLTVPRPRRKSGGRERDRGRYLVLRWPELQQDVQPRNGWSIVEYSDETGPKWIRYTSFLARLSSAPKKKKSDKLSPCERHVHIFFCGKFILLWEFLSGL